MIDVALGLFWFDLLPCSATASLSIFMGGWDGGMFVDPMTLQPGEARQVTHRLREVLTRG